MVKKLKLVHKIYVNIKDTSSFNCLKLQLFSTNVYKKDKVDKYKLWSTVDLVWRKPLGFE